jgi:hypothetical protein
MLSVMMLSCIVRNAINQGVVKLNDVILGHVINYVILMCVLYYLSLC